jgi:hypothetical protein
MRLPVELSTVFMLVLSFNTDIYYYTYTVGEK